ncbi:type 1 glutamine amidotransferase family protein [Streptomyces kebangsaanensis]|uniref:hypothetical protein n=1 Tax=Streptomyces kebangsaanensis TaxID=864058 RepID=UPI000AFB92CB|nr:hypothetical protein [Streptomyces kebangsaanensis]
MTKLLFVMTGATYWALKDGTRHATGYWAEEFAAPYKALTEAGHQIVVAGPKGVVPNVDMMSLRPERAGSAENALDLGRIIRSAEEMRRPIRLSDAHLEDDDFTRGEIWEPYTVVDRNLYTGQNPASARVLAERLPKEALT